MPAEVYSERFIRANLALFGQANYVVPAGKRAIVVTVGGAATTPPSTLVVGSPGGFYFCLLVFNAAATAPVWNGRAVFYAGDTIQATNLGGACTVVVSGYLLEDP